mgnify:CR=1 FL=1
MKKYLHLIILIAFFSCEEEVIINLDNDNNNIVVEGAIEPGFPAYVMLTRSEGYFDPVNSNTYNELFIDDASVFIKRDDDLQHELTLITEDIIAQLEFILGQDINIPANTIYIDLEFLNKKDAFNQAGRSYSLEINWNNQIITAETTIPEPTPLDCLWVEKNEIIDDKDYKCDIRAVYSDPANIQNNILIRSKRVDHWEKDSSCTSQQIIDPRMILVDAGSDILAEGQQFETFFPRPNPDGGFPNGVYNASHYKKCKGGQDSVFIKEDVVLIKFCQIDAEALKFWRAVVRQAGSGGNPFAEPMNLPSNINGGLGAWTGYAPVYYRIPIIKDTIFNESVTPNITDIF